MGVTADCCRLLLAAALPLICRRRLVSWPRSSFTFFDSLLSHLLHRSPVVFDKSYIGTDTSSSDRQLHLSRAVSGSTSLEGFLCPPNTLRLNEFV